MSFAEAGEYDRAVNLFQMVDNGTTFGEGMTPGPACYDALIRNHVVAEAWHDVTTCYERMKDACVNPLPTSNDSFVLAAENVGGRQQVLEVLEQMIVTAGAFMTKEGYLHAVKVVIPELQESLEDVVSLEGTRRKLRELAEGEEKPASTRAMIMNLVRSLRDAEVEESREPSRCMQGEQLQQRRDRAWREVLKDLIEYIRRGAE